MSSSNMLTNLDFLNKGAVFPPRTQTARLKRYRINKAKFDNKLSINKDAYQYIVNLIDDKFRVVSYRMLINLYRKVSYKTADLLFVERPIINVNEESKNADTLKEIIDESGLGNLGYQGAIDVSRYGESIYTVAVEDEKGKIGITSPRYWFPVVSEDNLKEIKYHVLAWRITRTVPGDDGKPEEKSYIKYQIHDKGR